MRFKGFRRFEFVRKLERSHNFTFIVCDNLTGRWWLAKIFKNLERQPAHFRDLNHRSLLAFRLAKLVSAPVPETRLIEPDQINFSFSYGEYLYYIHPDEIIRQDKILITAFQGISLPSYLKVLPPERLANLREILEDLVFNLWLGNYDKKDLDYAVDDRRRCFSIDNTLLGPGFADDDMAIGAYAEAYALDEPADTGWTIGDTFLQYIRDKKYQPDFFQPAIDRILGLSHEQVAMALDGLNFYRFRSPEKINQVFLDFLLSRRDRLAEAIAEWCQQGYPRGQRPMSG